ncbi:MAG: Malate/L-lactate dehydrogenase, partial [Bacteroidota bacterium]
QAVLVPGDPERIASEERLKNGIPVHQDVVKDLHSLAEKFSIAF